MTDQPAETQPQEPDHLAHFHAQLKTLTPRAWVTPALLVINVAVFLVMTAIDKQPMSPTTDVLLRWGANFGPRTTGGQWWRLFTSMFVHVGVIHLLFNMAVLWDIGRFVERLVGSAGFLVLYVVCGLFGAIASIGYNPFVVSAGASGAIFGLYGILLGFLLRSRGAIPKEVLQRLQKSAVLFIGYNVLFGLAKSGIDNAAHFGGLGSGFLLGLVVAHPLTIEGSRGRLPKALLASLGGLVVLAGTAFVLPKAVDLPAEINAFGNVETQVIDRYNKVQEGAQKGTVSDADFVKALQTEILPPWRQEHQRFTALEQRNLPKQQKELVHTFTQYLDAREQWWTLLAKAVKDNDKQAATQAGAKRDEAEALLRKMGAK